MNFDNIMHILERMVGGIVNMNTLYYFICAIILFFVLFKLFEKFLKKTTDNNINYVYNEQLENKIKEYESKSKLTKKEEFHLTTLKKYTQI